MDTDNAIERTVTREIPALSLRAVVENVDPKTRTFDIVWTTGARVLRSSWFDDDFFEELSLDPKHVRLGRLNGGAPLLNSHRARDLDDVIGVVEDGSAVVDGSRGVARVRFPDEGDDPIADKIFKKVARKVIRNVSVGYKVHRFEKVEGGDGKIPVMRAVDWEPHEVSLVPIGADAGAGVRSAEKAEMNSCEFVVRGVEQEKENMQTEEKNKEPVAPPVAAPTADAIRAARLEGASEEAARISGINLIVRTAKLGEDVSAKLIAEKTSLDGARAFVLDEMSKRSDAQAPDHRIRVEAGESDRDKWLRGAGDWIFEKAGVAPMLLKTGHKCDGGEFRGMSLVDMCRESLERNGVKTRGMNKMDLVGKALTFRSGMNTTSDFSVLMETSLHKTLLGSYNTTPDTWQRFCKVGSVSDFRAHNRYRLGSFGVLDSVNEAGEFKNKSIPDGEKASITATTKGNIIALSRQAIINDDMGAFSDLAVRWGRAGKLTVEAGVYTEVKKNSGLGPTMGDSLPLFDAGHANIGSAAAISVASIDADRVLMASQTDPSGNEVLDLAPSILLVPIGLGGTARVLNDAQYDPDTANKLQRPNMVRGLFKDIVDTARITGTRRYMFASVDVCPTFEVAFLDGQQEPVMDIQEGFRVDGVEWKIRLDYGIAAIDWRGAVTNAGA